jgi:hypothetical protein
VIKALVFALLLVWCQSALADSCGDASNRVASAFIRRLARDASDMIAEEDVDVALVERMTLGVPAEAAARAAEKAVRLWRHTERKIHLRCLDADAADTYPGAGGTIGEVTDDLFNLYGLPWVSSLRSILRPFGKQCARVAILRAGYAARDQIRKGRDHWAYYWQAVDQVCPQPLLDDVRQASVPYLSALIALRQ